MVPASKVWFTRVYHMSIVACFNRMQAIMHTPLILEPLDDIYIWTVFTQDSILIKEIRDWVARNKLL